MSVEMSVFKSYNNEPTFDFNDNYHHKIGTSIQSFLNRKDLHRLTLTNKITRQRFFPKFLQLNRKTIIQFKLAFQKLYQEFYYRSINPFTGVLEKINVKSILSIKDNLIIVHYENGDVGSWNITSNELIGSCSLGNNIEWIKALDQSIITLDNTNTLHIWDIKTSSIKASYPIPNNNYLYGFQAYPVVEAPDGKIYFGFPFKIMALNPKFKTLELALTVQKHTHVGPYKSIDDAYIKRASDYIFEICAEYLIAEVSNTKVYVFDTVKNEEWGIKQEECFSIKINKDPFLVIKYKRDIYFFNLNEQKIYTTSWNISIDELKKCLDVTNLRIHRLENYCIKSIEERMIDTEAGPTTIFEERASFHTRLLSAKLKEKFFKEYLSVPVTLSLTQSSKIQALGKMIVITKVHTRSISSFFGLIQNEPSNLIIELNSQRTINILPEGWNKAELSLNGIFYDYIYSKDKKIGVKVINLQSP